MADSFKRAIPIPQDTRDCTSYENIYKIAAVTPKAFTKTNGFNIKTINRNASRHFSTKPYTRYIYQGY